MLLKVENLRLYYDKAMVLGGVSATVDRGELVSLVGPNGAGKTSFLRAITGLVTWERHQLKGSREGNIRLEGAVEFDGRAVLGLPAHQIARLGLVHCPEHRRPFKEMSVAENLRAGGYLCTDRAELARRLESVYELFPVLAERARQMSSTLSGGEQQMLAIARALMMSPRLLCIDEPSVGLAPQIKEVLFTKIQEINHSGVTILLVEQDVSLALAISHRSYILSHGRVAASGAGEDLIADAEIRQAYLGL